MIQESSYNKYLSLPSRLQGWLILSCCFSCLLLCARVIITGYVTYIFLVWNLFLAFIPWAIGTGIILNHDLRNNKIAVTLLVLIWLAFFPNSPYILTDLFHLKQRGSIPIWFDLVLVLSFAWTGLAFGFISLIDIEKLFYRSLRPKIIRAVIVVLLFAGSFGVYLGRFQRWNSWDFIKDPVALWTDIGDRFINPFDHPRTWGVTVFLGILLNMIFWTFKLFSSKENGEP